MRPTSAGEQVRIAFSFFQFFFGFRRNGARTRATFFIFPFPSFLAHFSRLSLSLLSLILSFSQQQKNRTPHGRRLRGICNRQRRLEGPLGEAARYFRSSIRRALPRTRSRPRKGPFFGGEASTWGAEEPRVEAEGAAFHRYCGRCRGFPDR